MPRRNRSRDILRYEIFLLSGNAEIKRPTMHLRKFRSPITMSRRAGSGPFKCGGVPRGILKTTLARKDADEEVRQEDQLRGAQNERRKRDKNVQGLLRLQEQIRSRIVD